METAFAHDEMIGNEPVDRHGPNGSSWGRPDLLLLGDAGAAAGEPALRLGLSPDELVEEARRRGIEVHVLDEDDDAASLVRDAEADAPSASRAETARSARSLRWRSSATCPSSPFRSGRATTSPATSASTATTRSRRSTRSAALSGASTSAGSATALFLNNVSLGLYAQLVHRRERHRRRREVFARMRALAILVTHREGLDVTVDGEPCRRRSYWSRTTTTSSRLSRSESGSGSTTGCCTCTRRAGSCAAPGRADGRALRDRRREHRLEAAVDGEPAVFETPVEFRIEPSALRVLVPPGLEDRRDDRERQLVAGR